MDASYSVTIVSHYMIKYEDKIVGELTFETDLREKIPWVDLRNVSSAKGDLNLSPDEVESIGKKIEKHLVEKKGYTRVELITA